MKDSFDSLSLAIIIITLILFVVTPFVKSFTKDLIPKTGVFLISVKLIMGS